MEVTETLFCICPGTIFAFFNNMKFKAQMMIGFFTAVNKIIGKANEL